MQSEWNIGTLEYWNDDLKKMTFLYLIPVKRNFTITQLSIFPEPNIPIFQYSSVPIFQHSNCDPPARDLQWQAGRSELTCLKHNSKGVYR